MLTEKTKKQI